MAKASKKKKSNNTNPIKKLSDIVPELTVYDQVKKHLSYDLLFRKAKCIARYSAEKNFSTSIKSKIRVLFSAEYFPAVRYRHDSLLEVADLSRDERNHWNHEFTEYYNKIKDLLFESLDNNVPNSDNFNELEREEIKIKQGLDFDAGTYLPHGIVDETTRKVTFPKPAKTRLETNDKLGETPVTLREFMSTYCEEVSQNILESRVKSLQGLAQKKVITLEHIREWQSGQSKKYLPSNLISNWETFRKKLVSLPNLKQS